LSWKFFNIYIQCIIWHRLIVYCLSFNICVSSIAAFVSNVWCFNSQLYTNLNCILSSTTISDKSFRKTINTLRYKNLHWPRHSGHLYDVYVLYVQGMCSHIAAMFVMSNGKMSFRIWIIYYLTGFLSLCKIIWNVFRKKIN
jgi:hypothetical protein